jgi:hypothetical protein
MESKELYSFTVFEQKERTVEEQSLDQTTGQEITIKKKVTEKVPFSVIIKKPTRRQIEDADLEYSVEMSKCIKKGILTKAMLAKKYSDTGGLMSESESQKLVDLYKSIYDLQNEMMRLEASTSKSEEIKNRLVEITVELTQSRKEIVDIESSYRALFDHTADSKAQNKVLLWYIINLSYIKKESDVEAKALYSGKEYEDRLVDFYAKEENPTEEYNSISKKLSTLMAFWFFNQASSKEDFQELDRKIEAGEL